jgi:hypothetical protein
MQTPRIKGQSLGRDPALEKKVQTCERVFLAAEIFAASITENIAETAAVQRGR